MKHPLAPWSLLLTAVLLLSLTACGGRTAATENERADERPATEDAASAAEADEEALPPVELATLARGPIEATLRFSTNLEAESAVEVFAEAARRVVELRVEEGDRVAKGELLLRLQDEEQRSALESARIELDKAEREYERQERLYDRQLISEQAMNDATYEVERLTLRVEDAERQLGYTEVRAPIAGTVTQRFVSLGDTVTVNQRLFEIVDFDSIVARVYVPENELVRLAVGQPARLFSQSLGTAPRSGEVLRIAPTVDPRTGTVKVTVAIPANQVLLPGMYVEVELVTDTFEDALLVPKRAVLYDDDQAFLFTYDDGTVSRLLFEVALEDVEHVMPAANVPLAVGDRVVVAGQAGLKSGTEVRVVGELEGDADAERGLPGDAEPGDDGDDGTERDEGTPAVNGEATA